MTREEAIRTLRKVQREVVRGSYIDEVYDFAIKALESEPQKKYPTKWCEQCDLWEDNRCVGVAQCKHNIEALKVISDDLISRAEAINRFCTLGTALEREGKPMITMVDAKYLFIKIIENMPSADGEGSEK